MSNAGAITLDLLQRAANEQMSRQNSGPFLVWSISMRDWAGKIGQAEALRILGDLAASTRPIFGDILTGMIGPPDQIKAAHWFIGAGSWPYTAPDPSPTP